MARNYKGEKLQMQFIEDCIIDELNEILSWNDCDFSKEKREAFINNPALFAKEKFDSEWNFEYEKRRTPILVYRVGEWIRNGSFSDVPCYWDDVDKLRDEWGYTTPINKWEENFYNRLGSDMVRYCHKHGVELGD